MPRIFQQLNDMSISNIVIMTDGKMECKLNDTICEEIASELLSDLKELPITFLDVDKYSFERFEKILNDSFLSLFILLNLDDSVKMQNLLINVSSFDLSRNAWLIVKYQEDYNNTEVDIQDTIFKSINGLRTDSQLYVLSSYKESFILYEIYKMCKNHNFLIKEVFDFDTYSEFNYTNNFIWKRRNDMEGCPLDIAYANIKEWFEVISTENNTANQLSSDAPRLKVKDDVAIGFPTKLLQMLKNNFNFSINWVHAKDDTIGVKGENSSAWIGMIGLLSRNEADISGFPVSVRPARKTVVTFSNSFETYEYRLFMKKPGPSASWYTFIEVFHPDYWMALGISFAMFSAMIASYLALDEKLKDRIHRSGSGSFYSSFLSRICIGMSATLLSLGSLDIDMAKEVSYASPTSHRMIFLAVCTFGMLNHYVFDAGLTSHLMVQTFDIPINNLGDILEKPSYQLLVWRGAADESFFSEANNPTVQNVWKKTLSENMETLQIKPCLGHLQ